MASLKRPWILGTAAAAAVALVAAFGLRSGKAVDTVTFQLSWTHNGGYAGYYAADQRGYYADERLKVSFVEGGASIDPVKSVLSGEAQFGLTSANRLVKARAEGKPVRALAAVHQISPTVFIALRESGITHPKHFVGKTISVSHSSMPILRAVMSRLNIGSEQYNVVHPKKFNEFKPEEVDVWVGFLFDTTSRMEKQGYDINIISPDNYGVHFYRNCIFTTDEFIAENPDVVRRFLRATLVRGWSEVVRQPETTGPLTAHYVPDADQAHENTFLTAMVPLIDTGQAKIGEMKAEVWAAMAANLEKMEVLDNPVAPNDIYTARFLKEIYGDGE